MNARRSPPGGLYPLVIAAAAATLPLQAEARFRTVMLALSLLAALGPLIRLCSPAWYRRRRNGLLLCIRLASLCLACVPYPIPEGTPHSCAAFLWTWLLNSRVPAAFFGCLAWTLPEG